ncbi:MAG: hypothetical protein ACR2K3_04570 [Nocardioides sp.]
MPHPSVSAGQLLFDASQPIVNAVQERRRTDPSVAAGRRDLEAADH